MAMGYGMSRSQDISDKLAESVDNKNVVIIKNLLCDFMRPIYALKIILQQAISVTS